jgi:hypothetical protein
VDTAGKVAKVVDRAGELVLGLTEQVVVGARTSVVSLVEQP